MYNPYSQMDPIYFKPPRKCCKARTRALVRKFFSRFYTPFSFIIWFLVVAQVNTCENIPFCIIIISLLAAFFNAVATFNKWRSDIKLITENQSLHTSFSGSVFVSDFIIHFICIVLSFWWIDDIHECIPIDRYQQSITWVILFVFVLCLHMVQYKITEKRIDYVTRQAYRHVDEV